MDELDFSEDDWRDMIKYYDEMHAGQYEEYCVAFIDIIKRDCISRK